jgi:hypothetical protein
MRSFRRRETVPQSPPSVSTNDDLQRGNLTASSNLTCKNPTWCEVM